MCGIAGAVRISSGGAQDREQLKTTVVRMTDRMVHRGPDADGVWVHPDANVAFGHRRLAIVDLSERGRQPMFYAEGRLCTTFNGEIYNFRELQQALEALGHRFQSASDTEVLLAAYAQWGLEGALSRMVGMFAFALWDAQAGVVHFARDRVGEKPLYVALASGYLYFASELSALATAPGIERRVDDVAVAAYLRDGYVPAPLSIQRGVWKLPPACYFSVKVANASQDAPSITGKDFDERPPWREYWSCTSAAQAGRAAQFSDQATALQELDRLLNETVRLHLQCDVPTGVFLSGGIDSSLVTAIVQAQSSAPAHSFTVAFDNPAFDESVHARAVAKHLGTKHEEFLLSEKEISESVPRLVGSMDEPTANASFFPVYLISGLARKRVTVVLSGDGGDELFAGYNRYALAVSAWDRARRVPAFGRSALGRLIASASPRAIDRWGSRLASHGPVGGQVALSNSVMKLGRILRAQDFQECYEQLTRCWSDPSAVTANDVRLPSRHWPSLDRGSALAQMLLADQLDYLPGDNLGKVDRASMAVSIETRLPLLDHRLIEFSWRLPDAMKLHGRTTKVLLRELLYRYVPKELVERKKMGFSVPVDQWLRGPLETWAGDLLSSRALVELPCIDRNAVARSWDGFRRRGEPAAMQIWSLVMLSAWLARQ